ncbi:hypothetical protein [Actinoplanes sp. HUAS TT8]|uniref:hypothetical protein n=1 Tax=Actinoplanes sp. HUAS TT8 TaxID=3447453 RepID=UPI003F525773
MSHPRTDRELLDTINGVPWITDLLALFDFDVSRHAAGPVEPVTLPGDAALEMIAGDGSGGAFFLVGSGADRPVVYVGTEGEGGLVAHSLRDALALVVGLPSLHDATAIPVHQDNGARLLAYLSKADEYLREDWPDLDQDRTRLRETLDLPDAYELLPGLHAAAADSRYRPVNGQGVPYRAMVDGVAEEDPAPRRL